MDIQDFRIDYDRPPLRRQELLADPYLQFQKWLQEAVEKKEIEPNAMSLATIGSDKKPSSRMVLLKLIDTGFVFFTNLSSRKGHHLHENSFAAATFWWPKLERQVSLEGSVELVSRNLVADYFAKRPRKSQIAAWTSEKQSSPLSSRKELEELYGKLEIEFKDKNISSPEFWGGFRIIPSRMEFWQGRPNRLHDRFLYQYSQDEWTIQRLFP